MSYRVKMKCFLVGVGLAAGLLALSSCSSAPAVDVSAEETTLRTLDDQWSATAMKNDVESTVAFYAPDAVLLAPNAPIATDAKTIRQFWAGFLGPGTALSWKVTKVEVAKSGDLGYVYGSYQLTMAGPKGGDPLHDAGKLVEIWKKQADGKWKCIVDTYNSDVPATPPVQTKK
jgi:ketosteroid isomerase-like protein